MDEISKEALGEETDALYQNAINTINNVINEGAQYAGNQLRNTGPSMQPANGPGGTLQYDWSRYVNPNVQNAISAIRTAEAKQALVDKLREDLRQAKKNYQNAQNNYTTSGGNGGGEYDISNGMLLNVNGINVDGQSIDTSNTALITPEEQARAIRQAEEYLGFSPVDWNNVDWVNKTYLNTNSGRNLYQAPSGNQFDTQKYLDINGVLNNGR